MRDINEFIEYIGDSELNKELIISYKKTLASKYKPATVNVKLIAINRFLNHIGKQEWKIKLLKIQSQIFASEEKELTIAEYKRLIEAAKEERIGIIIKTISSTDIRISELEDIAEIFSAIVLEGMMPFLGTPLDKPTSSRRFLILSERLL